MKPRVCILLPFYKTTNPVTAFSLMTLLDKSRMTVMLQYGDAFIAHSRNTLAERFLKTTCEWAVTFDDDMLLPCGNAKWFNTFSGFSLPDRFAGLHTVDRLLSHNKTLVGGLYWHRNASGRGVYHGAKEDEAWLRTGPHDTLKPVKWVGTGAMLIHRTVFEDIEKKFPNLARDADGKRGHWFSSSEHEQRDAISRMDQVLANPQMSPEARCAKVQEIIRESEARSRNNSGLGAGEDVAMCIRAAQAGHQPYVDCGLICGHIGTHVYGPRQT